MLGELKIGTKPQFPQYWGLGAAGGGAGPIDAENMHEAREGAGVAAHRMHQAAMDVRKLAGAGLTGELQVGLVELAQARGARLVAVGEQAAVGVGGQHTFKVE